MPIKTNKVWAIIVFFAGLLELFGLRQSSKDDTLSEYTWSKTKTPVMAGAVTGLMGWLMYHFSFGNGVPLSSWDAVFAGGGAVLGVIASITRRGRKL